MTDEKPTTMYDLERALLTELEETWSEHKEEDEDTQREWVSKLADSNVPVYTSDLIEVALSDLWLAVEEPELLAFGGKKTAIGCIAGNIYARLQETGQEWLDKKNEEKIK